MQFKSIGYGLGMAMLLQASVVLAEPFASHGTLAIGVERVFGINYYHTTRKPEGSAQESTQSSTSIAFLGSMPTSIGAIPRLNADVFLGPGISLGGGMMVQNISNHSDGNSSDPSTTYFLFAPRVGFGIPFNDTLALWPRLGLTYLHTKTSSDVTDANGTRESTNSTGMWYTTLDALLLISPIQHVAFNVGPSLDVLIGGPTRTNDGQDVPQGDTSAYSLGINAGLTVWF